VKELKKSSKEGFRFRKYLVNKEDEEIKLPGKVVKILRNKHNVNQPVYFVLKKRDHSVLATIEFYSRTYREFSITDTNDDTRYVIFDMVDPLKMWQSIGCFTTFGSSEQKVQKFVHAKIRIGQYELFPNNDLINQEVLPTDIPDVSTATEVYMSGSYLYLVYKGDKTVKDCKPMIVRYNIEDNSFSKTLISESVTRLKCFDNEYFYWRTVLGGHNDNRYQSNIYFDGIGEFSQFNKSH